MGLVVEGPVTVVEAVPVAEMLLVALAVEDGVCVSLAEGDGV